MPWWDASRGNTMDCWQTFSTRVMVSCAQSALTGAERYNKEQTWKRPIKVTENVTLSFCCPEELPLKAINHVQIYENENRCMCMQTCSINVQLELMKPYNPLQGIWRWVMLLKNMQKQKNRRKTQRTSAALVHDRAHRHACKSRLWHAARSNRSSPSFNTHYSEQQA